MKNFVFGLTLFCIAVSSFALDGAAADIDAYYAADTSASEYSPESTDNAADAAASDLTDIAYPPDQGPDPFDLGGIVNYYFPNLFGIGYGKELRRLRNWEIETEALLEPLTILLWLLLSDDTDDDDCDYDDDCDKDNDDDGISFFEQLLFRPQSIGFIVNIGHRWGISEQWGIVGGGSVGFLYHPREDKSGNVTRGYYIAGPYMKLSCRHWELSYRGLIGPKTENRGNATLGYLHQFGIGMNMRLRKKTTAVSEEH